MYRPNQYKKPKTTIIEKNEKSLTEQHHKDEVNIHNIMARYRQTGVLTHVANHEGQYLDYPSAPDFQEAQNIIALGKSLFESVPSHIRKDMDNDPAKFLDFMQNPANREAIEAYGLDASHLPETPPQSPPPSSNPPQEAPESPVETEN